MHHFSAKAGRFVEGFAPALPNPDQNKRKQLDPVPATKPAYGSGPVTKEPKKEKADKETSAWRKALSAVLG